MNSTWLTDPAVPSAEPRWGRRLRRRGKSSTSYAIWRPQEFTAFYDGKLGVIFYAHPGELTDFASTPAGDGFKGVLRGAGRLHDFMDKGTHVLVATKEALRKLSQDAASRDCSAHPFTLDELIDMGWELSTRDLSIWQAGGIYYRMLRAGGFPHWRAHLHRFGLRMFQHFYRWAWAGNAFEDAGPRTTKLK
ncbi:MAG: hypothetical protein ACQKBW_13145 [Puniceicoccales bacterium]